MPAWLDPLVTFLFKFPARAFARGELVTAPVLPPLVLVAGAVLALGLIALLHARLSTLPRRDRAVLATLRAGTVLLLVALLFRPGLVTAAAIPQRNLLAVVMDESRSMQLRDASDRTRLRMALEAVGDSSRLLADLGKQFALRRYRMAADARPVGQLDDTTARGTRTDLAQALRSVEADLQGEPLAGIVLVTDGADNAGGALDDALLALRARRIPVYPVGVGRARFADDIGIDAVSAPRQLLAGASTTVDAVVRVAGLSRTPIVLTAEVDGRVVATDTIPPDARATTTTARRLTLPPLDAGTRRLTVVARPAPGERVTENNRWDGRLVVRGGPDRILYVEGEPRPEFAFLRRAVAGDSALQVVGLLRSAERKFLRLGVRDSLELITGFPTTREELFRYRAVVLGSVEAGFFSVDQLRMLADFVNVRGGSLLALGGRSALGEGGYAGTPVAEVLPITLSSSGASSSTTTDSLVASVQLRPTAAAERQTVWAPTRAPSTIPWDSLPPLTLVNRLGLPRPGATVLLAGTTPDGPRDVPMLTTHRYGRGSAAVFAAQDSWLWRMDTRIPVEDETHARFWRHLMRRLVEEVPERVELSLAPGLGAPGDPATIMVQTVTGRFEPMPDARVSAVITTPTGSVDSLPLEPTLREALLRRIADLTGGRYYAVSEVDQLARDAVFTSAGLTIREAHDLWDMPVNLFLLILLLGAEWGYRRWRGLA